MGGGGDWLASVRCVEAAFLKGREARLYWTVVLKAQLPMRGIGICIYEKGFHDV